MIGPKKLSAIRAELRTAFKGKSLRPSAESAKEVLESLNRFIHGVKSTSTPRKRTPSKRPA